MKNIQPFGCKQNQSKEGIKNVQPNWLNMICHRLHLAKDLLKDDGIIFISTDENEVRNLRKICDEVFGSWNFVSQLIIQTNPRGRTFDRFIVKTHKYVLVYTNTIEQNKNDKYVVLRSMQNL